MVKVAAGWSHIYMQKNQEEKLGSEIDHATRVPVWRNKASRLLAVKTSRGSGGRRVFWRDPQVIECTQTHPPGNQHQKGPI